MLIWRSGVGCVGAYGNSLPPARYHSLFTDDALHPYRRIGKDLSNTFAKLEKLTICKCLVDLS